MTQPLLRLERFPVGPVAAGLDGLLRGSRSQLQLHAQILHAPVALDPVAGTAQQLQVFDMIRPALAPADDVIDFQVTRLEVRPAAVAMAALFPIEGLRVGAVRRKSAQVRALRYVGAVDAFVEQAQFVLHPALHQLRRLFADVDARPLPMLHFRRYAGRRASAEGIEDHIALVAAGRNDSLQQLERFLRRVAGAFLGRSNADICPQVRQKLARVFVEIDLSPRNTPAFGPVNSALLFKLIEAVFRKFPDIVNASPFIRIAPPERVRA